MPCASPMCPSRCGPRFSSTSGTYLYWSMYRVGGAAKRGLVDWAADRTRLTVDMEAGAKADARRPGARATAEARRNILENEEDMFWLFVSGVRTCTR